MIIMWLGMIYNLGIFKGALDNEKKESNNEIKALLVQ